MGRLQPRASAPATLLIRPGNRPSARKIRTLRTTSWSRPRRPPRPVHIHHCVLVPGHHDLATQASCAGPVPFLRASGSWVIASFTPPLPISAQLRGFVSCIAPVHYKIGMMFYMFLYFLAHFSPLVIIAGALHKQNRSLNRPHPPFHRSPRASVLIQDIGISRR
ncbi:hypothetical protein K438DRAFT_303578 [Mycena galopus ATCC 62051]|nr:hypothetical protein K438DRAFT_303578 [Mycena galopus ATCC 62051]